MFPSLRLQVAEIKVNPKLLKKKEREAEDEGKSKRKKKWSERKEEGRGEEGKEEGRKGRSKFCRFCTRLLSELTCEQPRSDQIIHTFRNPVCTCLHSYSPFCLAKTTSFFSFPENLFPSYIVQMLECGLNSFLNINLNSMGIDQPL